MNAFCDSIPGKRQTYRGPSVSGDEPHQLELHAYTLCIEQRLSIGLRRECLLPVLISDFERVKEEAADTLLRKIKEYCPGFELKEQERIDFVDFSSRSTAGLRHAHIITRITVLISLVLCGISLAALCWAALKPDQEVSSGLFFAFVGTTLIGGPLLYAARDAYLKWLYSILVIHGTNRKADAELFAGCVKACSTSLVGQCLGLDAL